MAAILEITIRKTADDIRDEITDREAEGWGFTLELRPQTSRVWNELEDGAEDVCLYSSDGAVYLARVQDWDSSRGYLVIEMR